jgi:threonine/homoserine efflux transporter RhtA
VAVVKRAWLALGLLGVLLLVPFEHSVTLVLGIGCLLAFVAWGVFLIATPEFLDGDGDGDDDG